MWFEGGFHDVQQVNVNRESTCEGGDSGQMWQVAFAQVKSHQIWTQFAVH